MPTLQKVKSWLEDNGWTDNYKAWMKSKGERAVVNTDYVYEWAHLKADSPDADGNIPWKDESVTSSYDALFGKRMTRQELRDLCYSNKEERKKLKQLVIDKWEAKEDAISSNVGFQKTFDID